jgi:hypothetical protein
MRDDVDDAVVAGIIPDRFFNDCCDCESCQPHFGFRQRMILCKVCGNKRCPHATDHRNPCTGSNEPGQPGSFYE